MLKGTVKAPQLTSPLLAGIVFSVIWLAAGALILSLLLHLTSLKEGNLDTYTLLVHGISALFGGLTAGKRSAKRGWYSGALVGALYFIIIIIISFLAANTSITLHSLVMLAVVLLAAAFGGMVGVNLKKG